MNFIFHRNNSCKKIRAVAFILAAVLVVLCAAPGTGLTVLAKKTTTSSLTNDKIEEKEGEIAKIEKEKNELKGKISDLKSIKKKLEAAKSDLAKYIEELDIQLNEIMLNIEDLSDQIMLKEKDIKDTTAELEQAEADAQAQHAAMSARIRMMYERGDSFLLELLISSSSLHELLNRAEYVEQVVAYDREMWENYKLQCEYVETCKQKLEEEMELLDETKLAAEEEQAGLQELIDEKNSEIKKYNNEIAQQQAAINEYEEDMSAADEEIKALEAVIAAEKKRLLEEGGQGISYDGGTFKFPLESYTRISDEYGWRTHPITGAKQFHNGVDFASPYGTAIYAAYDGKVVAAAYSSTMGNYIMIDHGDGLYTIYMHASSLYVSKDEIVVKGEKIAAVGSTGRSTGNHLHFSVRKNGEYTSPWNYLSK